MNVSPGLAACLVAAASWTAGCATARNFDDPAGPRYTGNFAPESPGSGRATVEGPLRIVTFNIEFAREIDRALDLFRTSEALRDFDVLMLQEMDGAGAERIARAFGMNFVYFPGNIHPHAGRESGAAILSPWPLVEASKLVLPYPAFITNARRAATSAVMLRGGVRVRVMTVHLPAPGSVTDDERREQVRLMLDSIGATSDAVVVGGDFNSRRVGEWFTDRGFTWLTESLPGTARGMGRWWRYDHVFVRGFAAAPGGPSVGFVEPAGASDHRAVWARVVPGR